MYKRKLLPDEIALIPEILKEVMSDYFEAGKEIYLVGGGVRNLLSGRVPENCDLTTNATPEESLEILKLRSPFYNNDFGTVSFKVSLEGKDELYEITTYRSEQEYSDFRRPDSVTWGKTIEQDVFRRDFTINSLLVGKTSKFGDWELLDLVGGIADFEKGVIRAVGEPKVRFKEDALRMMRAVRFATKLKFEIEKETLVAISESSQLLEKISKERIKEELWRILSSDFPADGLRVLISTGLINSFLPEILEGRGVEQGGHHHTTVLEHSLDCLKNCPSPDPLIRFAALVHDIGKPRSKRFKCRKCGSMYKNLVLEYTNCENCNFVQPTREMITFYGHEVVGARMVKEIAERLRLPKKQAEKLEGLVRNHMFNYQREMTDAAIRRLIRKIGKENISDMILLRIADRKGSGAKTTSWRLMELQKIIGEQLFEPMEINDMVVNGLDVIEMLGVKPGPIVGKILKDLFEEVLEDTTKNNREYLLGRIKLVANNLET